MSGPLGSDQWMYSTGFYPHEIGQSLRFNDDDSAYLSRTPTTTGNRKTFTWSGWVKRGNTGGFQTLFQCNGDGGYVGYVSLMFLNDALRLYNKNSISSDNYITTSAVYRDCSSWYHIVAVLDTSNATASERAKLYVNGEQVTSFSTAIYPPLDFEYDINLSGNPHAIGRDEQGSTYHFDGYMAEVNFIDGQALDATDFGEFKSGVWIPKSYSGTYGTNGFYLDFGNSGSLGADVSGNSNNWTPNGLAPTDQMLDSPTNSFCTMNPLRIGSNLVLFEGNLKNGTSATGAKMVSSTFGVTAGKWYWESVIINPQQSLIGVENGLGSPSEYVGQSVNGWSYDMYTGNLYNSGSVSYGDTFTTNDVIGIAVDMDSGKLWFSKNGTWQNSGSPTAGTNPAATNLAGTIFPAFTPYNQYAGSVANFGQDSSFAGNKTRQGNTDANGIGDFYYAPPAGYLALCTANLPDPVIDPAQDDVPADYFNTVLWTGDGTYPRSVTGVGFQPDFTWIKARSIGYSNTLYDAVRGTGTSKMLFSDANSAEGSLPQNANLSSFDADGFGIGSTTSTNILNNNGTTFVAWNWLAGNGTSTNTDGTITSTVSANQKAGFSIVSYTGNGAVTDQTVGHGLSGCEMVVVKNRSSATDGNWRVAHSALSPNYNLALNLTVAEFDVTASTHGGIGTLNATSNTFTLKKGGSGTNNTNQSGVDYIAYCFHSVDGYSKFGSYTGNGSADGTFVYCGFRPAFLLVKNTTTQDWVIYDNARDPDNAVGNYLLPNTSGAEGSYVNYDFLSNGFKLRDAGASLNIINHTYIFMAFAEMPFKYANAR